ncbi:MAG: hypothetical protein NVS9B6_17840 [Candidatus Limnocylindrales bacterium]
MRRRIRSLLASGYYGALFLKLLGPDPLAGRGDVPDADLDPLVDAVAFAETDPTLGGKYISFYDPDGIALELYALPAS